MARNKTDNGTRRRPAQAGLKVSGFTIAELPRLNWYQLQKAIYEGHGLYDKPPTREQGRRLVEACYAEYARRGVSHVAKPTIK